MLQKLLDILLVAPLCFVLRGTKLITFVQMVIEKRIGQVPAADALRFLFLLENSIYSQQGRMASIYGDGVHTKHRHMKYHDFFTKRISASEKVLDVGCGIGAVAYDVAEESGALVVGIDLNADHLAKARKRFSHKRVEYVHGDALSQLPEGAFDVVVMSNVLEHLKDRSNFLRSLVRVSKAKRFLIRVPLFERDWRVPLKEELGVDWRLDATHETEYTLESFAEEIAEAGFSIVHQEVRWGEVWAEVHFSEH